MKFFLAVIFWVSFWVCMNFGEVLTRYCEVAPCGQYREMFLAAVYEIDLNLEARRGGRKFDKDAVATWTSHVGPRSVMFGNVGEENHSQEAWSYVQLFQFFCLFAYLTPNIAFVIRAIDYLVSRVLMVCAKALSKYFTYIISFNSFTVR